MPVLLSSLQIGPLAAEGAGGRQERPKDDKEKGAFEALIGGSPAGADLSPTLVVAPQAAPPREIPAFPWLVVTNSIPATDTAVDAAPTPLAASMGSVPDAPPMAGAQATLPAPTTLRAEPDGPLPAKTPLLVPAATPVEPEIETGDATPVSAARPGAAQAAPMAVDAVVPEGRAKVPAPPVEPEPVAEPIRGEEPQGQEMEPPRVKAGGAVSSAPPMKAATADARPGLSEAAVVVKPKEPMPGELPQPSRDVVPDAVAVPAVDPAPAGSSVHGAVAKTDARPASPAVQIALAIVKPAHGAPARIIVELVPQDLGRVEMTIETDQHRSRARIAVERRETLDLLVAEVRVLERALAEAGLDLGRRGIEFTMRGDGGRDRDPPQPGGQRGGAEQGAGQEDAIHPPPEPAPLPRQAGLDITV